MLCYAVFAVTASFRLGFFDYRVLFEQSIGPNAKGINLTEKVGRFLPQTGDNPQFTGAIGWITKDMEEPMINIGLIDLLLLVILFVSLVYAVRMRNLLPFTVILIIILLIELERLVPGTMTALGRSFHTIDTINEQLPHIRIQPLVSIQP